MKNLIKNDLNKFDFYADKQINNIEKIKAFS